MHSDTDELPQDHLTGTIGLHCNVYCNPVIPFRHKFIENNQKTKQTKQKTKQNKIVCTCMPVTEDTNSGKAE